MSSRLIVTNALKAPGQAFPFRVDAVLEEMEVLSDPVRFEGVEAEGTYLSSEQNISVEGRARATVISRCARCLKEVVLPVETAFEAEFVHGSRPEDPDQYCYESSEVELTDAIRDALILALPIRFLCREDCKGLCPRCGTDLNTGSCSCQEGDDDLNPFAALRSIVENNEEV